MFDGHTRFNKIWQIIKLIFSDIVLVKFMWFGNVFFVFHLTHRHSDANLRINNSEHIANLYCCLPNVIYFLYKFMF